MIVEFPTNTSSSRDIFSCQKHSVSWLTSSTWLHIVGYYIGLLWLFISTNITFLWSRPTTFYKTYPDYWCRYIAELRSNSNRHSLNPQKWQSVKLWIECTNPKDRFYNHNTAVRDAHILSELKTNTKKRFAFSHILVTWIAPLTDGNIHGMFRDNPRLCDRASLPPTAAGFTNSSYLYTMSSEEYFTRTI